MGLRWPDPIRGEGRGVVTHSRVIRVIVDVCGWPALEIGCGYFLFGVRFSRENVEMLRNLGEAPGPKALALRMWVAD